MKIKRQEKPVLQVLLIAALALNATLTFVALANRNRMAQGAEKKDSVPAPTVITLESAAVEEKTGTGANSQADRGANAREIPAPRATASKKTPPKIKRSSRGKDEIIFLPSPALFRLAWDTILVTRRDGTRIVIPKGTIVRVAGISRDDKALVVSHRGNPDGLIAAASLEAIPDEPTAGPSVPAQRGTDNTSARTDKIPVPFRLSGGPYGGSLGLGGAQIFVGRNGQASGSLSR